MKKVFLKSMLLLCALIVGSTSVWADDPVTLYSETFGDNGSSNTVFSSYSGYSATTSMFTGTGTVTSHYTGSGKVGKNNVSVSDYDGASGKSAAWYQASSGTNTTEVLIISGIKISGYGSLNLSFGMNMTNGASNTNTTQVSYKIDDGSFQDFSFTHPTSSGWGVKSGSISGTGTSLTIKFTMKTTGGFTTRYDDIKLTGVALGGEDPTITFNDGSVRVGKTLNLSTLFASNSDGTVTYSISAGGSYASIDGSILTGVAVGSVTVQASQAASGGYNAGSSTATITVSDPALSSIAITTAPTKKTYDEGEVFNATGMVVTATFADASTENVTASCTWSPSGALGTSDVEVTVSYTYKDVTKTATQAITVNAYVQPTEFTIDMNYTWLGSSDGSNLDSEDLPVVKEDDHVTTTITDGTSTHPRGDTDYIRVYNGSTITFTAPAGYAITELEFTTGGKNTWTDPSVSAGLLSDKTWTGNAKSVTFTLSGSCFIASVDVTLSTTATITLADACTDGAGNYYGTFSHGSAFVVPAGLTVSTISVAGGVLTLTDYAEGDVVKANTGVLVSATSSGAKTIDLSAETGTEKAGNMLHPGGVNASEMSSTYSDHKFYKLALEKDGGGYKAETAGFYYGAAGGAAFDSGAGKAFLAVPNAQAPTAPSHFLFTEEENNATNIEAVEAAEEGVKFIQNGKLFIKKNGVVYDMLGTVVR